MAYVAYKAAGVLKERLENEGMLKLYREMEMPLIYSLYHMEQAGVRVDKEQLKLYGEQLEGKIVTLEQEIYDLAGETFNLNSPKQLGEILFERMQLPHGKKTKTGYSTAADVLEKLAPEYPVVQKILEYRPAYQVKFHLCPGTGRIHKRRWPYSRKI